MSPQLITIDKTLDKVDTIVSYDKTPSNIKTFNSIDKLAPIKPTKKINKDFNVHIKEQENIKLTKLINENISLQQQLKEIQSKIDNIPNQITKLLSQEKPPNDIDIEQMDKNIIINEPSLGTTNLNVKPNIHKNNSQIYNSNVPPNSLDYIQKPMGDKKNDNPNNFLEYVEKPKDNTCFVNDTKVECSQNKINYLINELYNKQLIDKNEINNIYNQLNSKFIDCQSVINYLETKMKYTKTIDIDPTLIKHKVYNNSIINVKPVNSNKIITEFNDRPKPNNKINIYKPSLYDF